MILTCNVTFQPISFESLVLCRTCGARTMTVMNLFALAFFLLLLFSLSQQRNLIYPRLDYNSSASIPSIFWASKRQKIKGVVVYRAAPNVFSLSLCVYITFRPLWVHAQLLLGVCVCVYLTEFSLLFVLSPSSTLASFKKYMECVYAPTLCRAVGGTMLTRQGPSGQRTGYCGRQAVWTMARHHRQRQSCSLRHSSWKEKQKKKWFKILFSLFFFVLNNSPKHRSARFVANGTFGRDGQIAFHPLMWHGDVLRHSSKRQF